MRKRNRLEPTGQALGQSPPDQHRRGSEKHDAEIEVAPGVFVPVPFHGLRPAGDLLHLVDHEDGTVGLIVSKQPRPVPLGGQPAGVTQRRFVGRDEEARLPGVGHHLLHERGLADLPGARDDLQKAAWLPQPRGQDCRLIPAKNGLSRFTHDAEYFYSAAVFPQVRGPRRTISRSMSPP